MKEHHKEHKVRRYLGAGLLVWVPIWVVYVVIKFIITLLDGSLTLLPHQYQPEQLFGRHIPGIGFLLTILILFITGMLATNVIGRYFVAFWESILQRIPLVRSIYAAVKQVLETIFQSKTEAFRDVILVEYPRKGIWSIGFQTSNQFQCSPNDDTITIFIPTTPNPTSGFMIFAERKDTRILDISVEEAFKMVISLGVVVPEQPITNA